MTHFPIDATTVNVEIVHEPAQVVGSAIIHATNVVRVTVKPEVAKAHGIDRADVYGCSVGLNVKLGARLVSAILAGRAVGQGRVARDVNGKTYVANVANVFGRRLNADLKRLGF